MKKFISIMLIMCMLLPILPVGLVSAEDVATETDYLAIPALSTEYAVREKFDMKNYTLKYYSPAPDSLEGWTKESLPLSNGYMGISAFGGVEYERLQITEQSMYGTGGSYTGSRTPGHESFGDLYIDTNHNLEATTNYKRYLSLNNATAGVKYTFDGVDYKREYFTTYPDKVAVIKLSASGEGNINVTVRPEIAYERDKLVWAGVSETANTGKHGTVVASEDSIVLSGNSEYFDIDFEAQIKVILKDNVGTITANNSTNEDGETDNGTLTVSGANECYIIMAVGTNYIMNEQAFSSAAVADRLAGNPHPHERLSAYINAASSYTYDELLSRHKADYQEYFNRNVFDIGGVEDDRATSELIASYKAGTHEKYLEELYYQFGRYMLIAASRKGNLPTNLQGMWNAYDVPPWSNGFWYNVNQQMNYWPTFVTNLAEMYEPYFDFNQVRLTRAMDRADTYIRNYMPDKYDGVRNNGWIVGTSNSAFNVGSVTATGHSGPGTGGFTAVSDVDYYRFTNDTNILKKVYPVLQELARFYTKVVDNYDGKYLVTLSASPENRDKVTNEHIRTTGCAFDQQMVYEINKTVVDMYDKYKDILTGVDTELIETIRLQLDKYDQVIVGYSGQVKEYREEKFYGDLGEYNHRHISHLVGLYPGNVINDDTPHWMDAAKVTLRERGIDDGIGWASAHKMSMYARTGDGDMSYYMFNDMLNRHTFDNLWDCIRVVGGNSDEYFQVEGNFGSTAGVAEMLLQSHGDYVKVLPALPSKWADGSFKGMVARGNFDFNADWTNGVATKIEVSPKSGGLLKLDYPNISKATLKYSDGTSVSFETVTKDRITINTTKDKKIIITDIPYYTVAANISDVTATKSESAVTINWTASTDSDAKYTVYRAFESEPDYEVLATNVSATSYIDTERDGRQATYKVTAIAENKEESLGKTVTVLPDAKLPDSITAFMADETHLQIQWKKSDSATSYKIYENNDGVYTLADETENNVFIIENPSSSYAISSVAYTEESEKTDIIVLEKGELVSKVALYKVIEDIEDAKEKDYQGVDTTEILKKLDDVIAVWNDLGADESKVLSTVDDANIILAELAAIPVNVVKDIKGTIVSGSTELYDNLDIDLMTDGIITTRYRGAERNELVVEYDIGNLYNITGFKMIDYCESADRSRSEYYLIEGMIDQGKWIKLTEYDMTKDSVAATGVSNGRDYTTEPEVSVPVKKIRVTMKNTDSCAMGFSVWEMSVIGTRYTDIPSLGQIVVNPSKPAISEDRAIYEIVPNIKNGTQMYSDITGLNAVHMGKSLQGLTQIRVPAYDSTRSNNAALNTFLKGDNTYLTFNPNRDGKVYVTYSASLPNYTSAKGWTLVSSKSPTLPSGASAITDVSADYVFEDAPYYISKFQYISGELKYSDRRPYTYMKEFKVGDTVEIPTIGLNTNENLFITVDISDANTNTDLEYIFYDDEYVKVEKSGSSTYTIGVETESNTVTFDAVAKNSSALVTIEDDTIEFKNNTAIGKIRVSAGENEETYTVIFKKYSNVALNKPITVTPTSKASAGTYGSFSNEAIVDGSFDNATGRYYSGEKAKVTAEIDLGGKHYISSTNVSEFRGTKNGGVVQMRIDKLVVEAYVNDQWVTVVNGLPLDGELINNSSHSLTSFEFTPVIATKLRYTFNNTGAQNGENTLTDSYGNLYYETALTTASGDISIVEIEAIGYSMEGSSVVSVTPDNSSYDMTNLTDSDDDTFYQTTDIDFASESAQIVLMTNMTSPIKSVLFTPRAYDSGEEYYYDRPTGYKIYSSSDNITYTLVTSGEISYADFNDADTKAVVFDDEITANYIKIEFTDVYGARADGKKYLSLAEIALRTQSETPIEPLDGFDFYNLRDGFDNSYIKFKNGGEATVAFLGGSITNMTGFRTTMESYLREKFPDTEFTFINAGIASTDSTLGAFRLNNDILSKGDIDLLFVEFSVNDEVNNRTEEESHKGLEGIIRRAYTENPYIDIMYMHFEDQYKHAQYSNNENNEMPYVTYLETICDYYNVTSLNLAKEVSARIENGELTWEDFGGMHPSALGHKIYSDGMIAVLEKYWETAGNTKTEKTLPDLYNEYSYVAADYMDISDATLGTGFNYVSNWAPTDGVSTRPGFVNVPMLESTEAGATLTYKFTGTDIGILLPAGPDVAIIEYKIDNGETKTRDLFTSWSKTLHIPFVYMLATELDYGEHTLTITASTDKNSKSTGNAVRIQQFLVNAVNDEEEEPEEPVIPDEPTEPEEPEWTDIPDIFSFLYTGKVTISGNATLIDSYVPYLPGQATLVLYEDDGNYPSPSDIKYIKQTDINPDGTYIFDFKYKGFEYENGKVKGYKVAVSVNGVNANKSIDSITSYADSVSFDYDITTTEDKWNLKTTLKNIIKKPGLDYKVYTAFYGEDERLMGLYETTATASGNSFDEVVSAEITIPENSIKAKVLVWINDEIPITKAFEKSLTE